MTIESKEISITELKPNPNNPRFIKDANFRKLVQSLKTFPEMKSIREIVVDEDMVILGGNMRYKAMLELKEKKVLVKIVKGLTEQQKKEFIIKDNSSFGEYDFDILTKEFDIKDLIEWGMEETDFTFDNDDEKEGDFDLLVDSRADINGIGRVYGLVDTIEFEFIGEYEMPVLKDYYVKDTEINHSTYYGIRTKEKPPYYFIYGTASIKKTNLENAIISFYTEDVRFKAIMKTPSIVTTNLLNAKVMACVSPDFSTYFDMSRSVRLFNIYQSRWAARYFQEAGIKIIPNIIGGNIEEIRNCLVGIPKGTLLSIQVHRKYDKKSLQHKKTLITEAINLIEPSALLVYSTPEKLNQFEDVFKDVKIINIDTFINKRQKEVIPNG